MQQSSLRERNSLLAAICPKITISAEISHIVLQELAVRRENF
jgi:hypothetical protein